MNLDSFLLVFILLSSFVTGLVIFFLREEAHRLRTFLNLLGAGLKMAFVGVMIAGVRGGHGYESRLELLPGLDLVLRADAMSVLFVTLSTVLWFLTTLYAVGYLEGEPHRSRFFGFFSICVSATTGVALSGNFVTFLIFYELLTLSTYPLVVHNGTEKALRAGRNYLIYTLSGGALLMFAAVWLHTLAGSAHFAPGGTLSALAASHRPELINIFALLIAGLGVKAALVPFHGWLPQAMVAPAPVSALLHAVAVVKAGAFGIVLVVYDLYGIRTAEQLGVLPALAALAAVLLYALHHALAKGAMFLGVGVAAHAGIGKPRRWLFAGFLLPALALIGVSFTSGTLAKAALKEGAAKLPDGWAAVAVVALPLAATGTTLLMARFLWLVWSKPAAHGHSRPALWVSWALLLGAVAVVVWILPLGDVPGRAPLSLAKWWSGLWPFVLGVTLAGLVLANARKRGGRGCPNIPAGDWLAALAWLAPGAARLGGLLVGLGTVFRSMVSAALSAVPPGRFRMGERGQRAEDGLRQWPVAGPVLLLLAVILYLLVSAQ